MSEQRQLDDSWNVSADDPAQLLHVLRMVGTISEMSAADLEEHWDSIDAAGRTKVAHQINELVRTLNQLTSMETARPAPRVLFHDS